MNVYSLPYSIMPDVFLSLGSNIGDREKNILTAIKLIGEISSIRKVSSLYETEPVGFKEQEYFYNVVLKIYTELLPLELLPELKYYESKLGKKIQRRFGPRSIDIDVLYYGREIIESVELTIPHPGINERRFVLVPLTEIDDDFICPKTKLKISDIMKNCNNVESVKKIKGINL